MLNWKKCAITTLAALIFTCGAWAGDHDGLTTSLEDHCIDGEMWVVTVWWFWNIRLGEVKTFDKMEKCCSAGGHLKEPGVAAPRDDSNSCPGSTTPQGGNAANANSSAGVSSGDQTGTGQPVTGPVPPQPGTLAGTVPRAIRDASHQNAAASAFPRTVPFRLFPFTTFFNISGVPLPTSTPQCNSQLNPTMLAIDHLGGQVNRLNMCSSASVTTIAVPSNPLQVRVTPDGSQAIVTSYDNAISFINTTTNAVTVLPTDPNTFPSGLAISPDGSYALVTNYLDVSPALLVVDIASKSVTNTISLDQIFPQSVYLNPDATLAWVTYPWVNTVEVIDLLTGNVNYAFSVLIPYDVAFNATGTTAYIASGAGSILFVDTKTYAVTATLTAGEGACDLTLTPDGRILTVNNYLDGTVTVIDTVTMASQTYPVAGAPRGNVLAPVQ
jgi:DNA-binding beta-propeller fold protein YncE